MACLGMPSPQPSCLFTCLLPSPTPTTAGQTARLAWNKDSLTSCHSLFCRTSVALPSYHHHSFI